MNIWNILQEDNVKVYYYLIDSNIPEFYTKNKGLCTDNSSINVGFFHFIGEPVADNKVLLFNKPTEDYKLKTIVVEKEYFKKECRIKSEIVLWIN